MKKKHFEDGTYDYPLQNYKNFNHIHMFANFFLVHLNAKTLFWDANDDSNSDLIHSILQSLFLLFEPLIGIYELLLGGVEVALKF